MKALIFGCGFSGTAIAQSYAQRGAAVAGTARSPEKLELLHTSGIKAVAFDGERFSEELLSELTSATHIVQSIPPAPDGDPVLKLLKGQIRNLCPNLQWVGYLSTVGVYGDHDGGWVTENTPTSPTIKRSIERVWAETAWTDEARLQGVPVAALRLAGIYGPGRNAFINLERGTARRIVKKGQVFNRVRVEDIGDASVFLGQKRLGDVFNVSDDLPAPPQDVIAEAARLMGIDPPPEQDFETADMTPMARSFYSSNKRVSNHKLKSAGFEFLFPTYSMSLEELWRGGHWHR